MLRFLTAGESHGKALVTIIEGVPAGLAIDIDALTADLRRRQTGYGRGRRMLIESDRAEPLSGVRHGLTTGGPIALLIPNKDWENWQRTMYAEPEMPAAATPSTAIVRCQFSQSLFGMSSAIGAPVVTPWRMPLVACARSDSIAMRRPRP